MSIPISPAAITNAVGNVLSGANIFKKFTGLAKRKSIMSMAQPGIYQYPIVMSTGIDTDVQMAIAKAFQMTFASSVATAYSLNPIMRLSDTPNVSDFVQRFHTNDDLPLNVNAARNVLGVQESMTVLGNIPEDAIAIESAFVKKMSAQDLEALNINSWDCMTDAVSMESLNDLYRPYDKTKRILSEKLKTLKETPATEALQDDFDNLKGTIDRIDDTVNGKGPNGPYNTGVPLAARNERRHTNKVMYNNNAQPMEPTMVDVQIMCHGNGQNGNFTQNLTLGVKTMPRVISSDLMIASMVEACKESNAIFKFLKWTKGEVKTLDFVLGISASKKKVLEKNAKNEIKLLNQAKKRKKINGVGKFLNNNVLPTLTIVLTSYEVEKIKEACNVDLDDFKQAMNLINKYFLLSFAIYNNEQDTLKVLFDCDSDWSYTTIGAMKTALSKTSDVLDFNQIAKIMNRR